MAVHHARSNSLPTRKHPLVLEFDQLLSRLRSSREASPSTSIACKLSELRDLYDCVDQLLLLPLNQQALSSGKVKQLGKVLDGSLRILDICSIAKDAFSQTKEFTQELQSIMWRRRGGESDLTSTAVKKFLDSRRTVKKAIVKAMENGRSFSRVNKDQMDDGIVNMLREVGSITLAVFDVMFSFISGSNSQKSSGWSLVSKLMKSKRVGCEEVEESNEFECVDATLQLLVSTKKYDGKFEENKQQKLQRLAICVQDLEEGVESFYRRLIETRVSLLNIVSH